MKMKRHENICFQYFYASKIRIHDIHKITNHREKLKSVCLIITLKCTLVCTSIIKEWQHDSNFSHTV